MYDHSHLLLKFSKLCIELKKIGIVYPVLISVEFSKIYNNN